VFHAFAALALGYFSQNNVPIQQCVAFVAIGVIEIGQPRPNKEPDDYVVSIRGVIALNFIGRDFGITFIFDGNFLASELGVIGLAHCNRVWDRGRNATCHKHKDNEQCCFHKFISSLDGTFSLLTPNFLQQSAISKLQLKMCSMQNLDYKTQQPCRLHFTNYQAVTAQLSAFLRRSFHFWKRRKLNSRCGQPGGRGAEKQASARPLQRPGS
jgi:hypothetical protein